MIVDVIGSVLRRIPFFRGKGRLAGVLLKPLVKGRGYQVLVEMNSTGGGSLLCNLDDWIPWNVYIHGSYKIEEHYERVMIEIARQSQIIFDIGANIGYYSVQFGRVCTGKVFSFEPVSYQHDILNQNISINNLQNVSVEKLIVSDQESSLRVYFSGNNNSGSSSLECVSGTFEDVRSVTLDSYAKAHGVSSIDLIKIDVEGHELKVLKGFCNFLENGAVKHLFIEINSEALSRGGTSPSELCSYLEAFGYKAYSISSGSLKPYLVGTDESLVLFKRPQ